MYVYEEVKAEREYQLDKWGPDADLANLPNDFVAYIGHHSTRWFNGGFAPYPTETVDAFRRQMVKVAALAVAAVEAVDQQREEKGKTFYEQAVGA